MVLTAADYYFRFPNKKVDVVGFGGTGATPETFHAVLREKGVEEGRFRGAFVFQSLDYSIHDRIILIGDAGGFANRTTYEGLYNAFLMARNAFIAIIDAKPFRKINRRVFRKTRRGVLVMDFFYSRFAFAIIRWMCGHPRLAKVCVDLKL